MCWTRWPRPGLASGSSRDSWADTTTPHGRLMLTMLGGLAEFERELIRARTGEGRAVQRPVESVLGRMLGTAGSPFASVSGVVASTLHRQT